MIRHGLARLYLLFARDTATPERPTTSGIRGTNRKVS
jgi:hypothetical protein